jgi:hypothetical protein
MASVFPAAPGSLVLPPDGFDWEACPPLPAAAVPLLALERASLDAFAAACVFVLFGNAFAFDFALRLAPGLRPASPPDWRLCDAASGCTGFGAGAGDAGGAGGGAATAGGAGVAASSRAENGRASSSAAAAAGGCRGEDAKESTALMSDTIHDTAKPLHNREQAPASLQPPGQRRVDGKPRRYKALGGGAGGEGWQSLR